MNLKYLSPPLVVKMENGGCNEMVVDIRADL